MQFTEVSEEELAKMEFAGSRGRAGKNPYGDLLEAVKSGKTVRVPLEAGKQIKNLKWGISQAAKKADMKIAIRVLADQSGVVVSCAEVAKPPPTEAGASDAEALAAGVRSRK